MLKKYVHIFGLILFIFVTYPLHAQHKTNALPNNASYIEKLISRTTQVKLWKKKAWLRLGHWRKGVFGYTSEIDGKGFFLAKDGKKNPKAELIATIRAFFSPKLNDLKPIPQLTREQELERVGALIEKGAKEHPMCRFPARFLFLAQTLKFDFNHLQQKRCSRFERFYQRINPVGVSVVFSSYYINTPASAFGHTLLRFHRGNAPDGSKRAALTDYGINFSADVDSNNALVYGIKGLTGLFPGTFKAMPFYYKVREYNDYEARDLWEYKLNLSPTDLRAVIAHIWELGHSYIDYFYLTENCSYQLLALIEAAIPRLDLLDKLGTPVIPSNTIKALYQTKNLVKSVHYRPSLRIQFEHRLSKMSSDTKNLVKLLFNKPKHKISNRSKKEIATALDAAEDLVDLKHSKELYHKTDTKAAKLKQKLMQRRADLGITSEPLNIPIPWHKRPDKGHGFRRVGLGFGYQEKNHWLQSFDFRWSLHDLLDSADGYPELLSIEFFPLSFFVDHSQSKIELDNFSLIRIQSLVPISSYEKSFSWRLDIGATSFEKDDDERGVAAKGIFGFGLSFSTISQRFTFFTLLDTHLLIGDEIEGIEDSVVRLGFGPSAGLRINWHRKLNTLIEGHYIYLPKQEPFSMVEITSSMRFSIHTNLALDLRYRFRQKRSQILSRLFVYF